MNKIPVIAVVMISLLTVQASAQRFVFDTTGVTFRKSIAFGTVHGYLEIHNNTQDTIPMRWRCKMDSTYPAAWQLNFDDQNQLYFDVRNDSAADFYLYPSGTFPQKLIVGLAHQQVIDTQDVRFDIWPTDSAGDTVEITYRFEIYRTETDTTDSDTGSTGIASGSGKAAMRLRSFEGNVSVTCNEPVEEIKVFDLQGRMMFSRSPLAPMHEWWIPAQGPMIIIARTASGLIRQKWIGSP